MIVVILTLRALPTDDYLPVDLREGDALERGCSRTLALVREGDADHGEEALHRRR